jgi:hypothetical protein
MERYLFLLIALLASPAQAETVVLGLSTQWWIPRASPDRLFFGGYGTAEIDLQSGADRITIPSGVRMTFGEHTDFDERLKTFFRNDPPVESVLAKFSTPTGQLHTSQFGITTALRPTGDWQVTGATFMLDGGTVLQVVLGGGTYVRGRLELYATGVVVPEPAAWVLVLCGLPVLLRRSR